MHTQGFCKSHLEDPLEVCLSHFGYDFDDNSVICEVNALLDSTPLLDTNKWKPKLEPLVFTESRLAPLVEKSMTLTLNNETVEDDNGSISHDINVPLSPCFSDRDFLKAYVNALNKSEFSSCSLGTNHHYCRIIFSSKLISWVDPQLFRLYIYDLELTLGYQPHLV